MEVYPWPGNPAQLLVPSEAGFSSSWGWRREGGSLSWEGGHYCCAPADAARGAGVEVGGAGLGPPPQVPQPWGMGRAESVRIPDVSGDNGGRQDLT